MAWNGHGMDHAYRAGFTLIEVMVAMSIIAILMGLLMPCVTVMRRMAKQSATQAVMKKADTCLRLFKTDWEVYPGQMSYPDLSGGNAFTNRLAYQVGSDLSVDMHDRLIADIATASGKFAYNALGSENATELSPQPSSLTYTCDLITNEYQLYNVSYKVSYACLVNRMAREQVRLGVASGNLWMRGPVISNSDGTIIADKSATPLLTTAEMTSNTADPGPGWACDYLAGDLDKRYVKDQSILDAWGQPLVYICQSVPGIAGTMARVYENRISIKESKRYGLGPLGFDTTTGPGPSLNASRPHLLYGGRITLSATDAGDAMGATPTHGTFFPDLGDLMRSDVRYYAAPGFSREFELWSCGPDRSFDYMRDAKANRDNLSVTPYNKGL